MPEHDVYLNHVLACPSCYAPCSRYCDIGWELRQQASAAFIVTLDDIAQRRRWMASEKLKHPKHLPRLEELVREKYKERQ
jgi:hypothetical protein